MALSFPRLELDLTCVVIWEYVQGAGSLGIVSVQGLISIRFAAAEVVLR